MIPGSKTYRINTTDPSVAKRMKQRKDFEPAVIYYNVNVWDFRTDKYSKKDAIRTMQRVTRQRIKYNALNDEFHADYGVIVDSNKRRETT